MAQFRPRSSKNDLSHKKESMKPSKKTDISKIPSSISPRLSKKVLVMSKYYKDKGKNPVKQVNTQNGQSYFQVSLVNIKDIVKIKKMFPNFSTKKIEEI